MWSDIKTFLEIMMQETMLGVIYNYHTLSEVSSFSALMSFKTISLLNSKKIFMFFPQVCTVKKEMAAE